MQHINGNGCLTRPTHISHRRALLLMLSSIPLVCSGAAMAPGSNPGLVAEMSGVIAYTVESDGSFRGEEHWRVLVHPDGSRTSISTVRLDATEVVRTVTQRVDKNMRPLDAYQHLWSGGMFRGSGYFQVRGDTLHTALLTPTGTLEQTVAVPEHFSWVNHPLATDAWHMSHYDRAKKGRQSTVVFNTHTLGDTIGSISGRVHPADLELVGTETIDVPAGRFETEKFLMAGTLEIWIEPKRLLMVRMRVAAADRLYELTKLETTTLN